MLILALDSTAQVGSVALCEDETLIAEYTLNTGHTHSETLLPMVESVLKITGYTVDDVDLFVCTAGPGSFTGVRIGAATVKGLAFGKNKICIGVSTLEAMARTIAEFCTDAIICPVMDARRNQLYNAVFEYRGGRLLRLTEDRTVEAGALAKELEAMDRPVYFIGDGYAIMEKRKLSCQRETPQASRLQNGYGVALAALDLYMNTEDKSVFTDRLLRPEYLRLPQAERELREKEARTKSENRA